VAVTPSRNSCAVRISALSPSFPARSPCYPSTQAHSVSTMSQVPSTATPSTDFEIFRAALEAYKQQTKTDISSHPLAAQLRSCDSPSAIIAVLRTQAHTFDQSQSAAHESWTKWLDPTVNVLHAFSVTLGSGVGVVSCGTLRRSRPTDVRDHRYSHPRMRFLLELVSSSK
jgi:hypothetical protein